LAYSIDILAFCRYQLCPAEALSASRGRDGAKKVLTGWQKDPDLAGLRDEKGLADLPEPERAECRALWGRVAVSLKRAAATD